MRSEPERRKERPVQSRLAITSAVVVFFCFVSFSQAAWTPPAGYARTGESFAGDAFAVAPDGKVAVATANFASGGATVKVYANASAAQAATSPLRTFTDPTFHAWGDLTFADNDTLLFSENFNNDTVYRGIVSSGAMTSLAPIGSIPNAGGIALKGSTIYVVAANNPGTGAVYTVSGGSASAILSNLGTGFLGGIAFDTSGTMLLTDTNDPSFLNNPGKLLRFDNALSPLSSIDLAGGGGSDAYDVTLDSEGDAFVTTNSTITLIPHGTTTAQQFGSAFTGFPIITNLDYIGSGFEPNSGSGKLYVNAVFSDDGSIFSITPIPEPASIAILGAGAVFVCLSRRRERTFAPLAVSLAVLATAFFTEAARADHFYATQVIDRTIGSQQQSGFTDPSLALGGPRGGGSDSASIDTYNLGNGGSITLGFNDGDTHRVIFNGPGNDFVVSENAFYQNDDPHKSFAEFMFVEVSTNGSDFARFPVYSSTLAAVGPFGTIDPDKTYCIAGVHPVYANVDDNTIDPFDPAVAGGDAFDLNKLVNNPLVTGGQVDLSHIHYVRLIDIVGDGSSFDAYGRPIFDPTGPGIGGADVDSVAVVNGTFNPEPALIAPAGCLLLLLARRR